MWLFLPVSDIKENANGTRDELVMGKNCIGVVLPTVLSIFIGSVAQGQGSLARVEIKTARSTVANNEEFSVSTTIRNVSRGEQSFGIWSCSYPEQWTADNLAVHITPASCKKNDVIRVTLRPGEVYERDLSIRIGIVGKNRPQQAVIFRLGFKSAPPDEKTALVFPIWSNAMTVNVRKQIIAE